MGRNATMGEADKRPVSECLTDQSHLLPASGADVERVIDNPQAPFAFQSLGNVQVLHQFQFRISANPLKDLTPHE